MHSLREEVQTSLLWNRCAKLKQWRTSSLSTLHTNQSFVSFVPKFLLWISHQFREMENFLSFIAAEQANNANICACRKFPRIIGIVLAFNLFSRNSLSDTFIHNVKLEAQRCNLNERIIRLIAAFCIITWKLIWKRLTLKRDVNKCISATDSS